MPPFWQYFSRLLKKDESIPDTKGRESWTPTHFSLQIRSFLGDRYGGHDGDRGPLWPPRTPDSPAGGRKRVVRGTIATRPDNLERKRV
jgi:hypothetical protein